MNLRPKTKRRLLALAAGGVVFTAAASVVVYVQLNREQNRENELRLDGLGAYQRGDYSAAVTDFKNCASNGQLDAEAIYAYAVSRSKVPLPDLGNLREAKSLFFRYLELKPGDPDAQHQLLDIYRRLNYTGEANALADSLLAHNPDDIPALKSKLAALDEQNKYPQSLRVAQHLNQLAPTDLRTQETTFDLMQRCKLPPAELTARADRMLAEHPNDPRFELLRADAAAFTGDLEGARRWLRTAATRTPPDAQTLHMLAGAMDRIGMWNDARALIEKTAATATPSSAITAAWVLRLWEAGQTDQALASLKSVTAGTKADSQLLGIKAMILFSLSPVGKPDVDATAALADLDHRQDDPAAAGWSLLLHADFVEGLLDPKRAVILGESACRQDPDNAVARFDLARAYLRLGESDLAIQCLVQTIQLAPGWPSPYVVMARTLLDQGQVSEAVAPAQAAFDRDSASSAAQTTLAIAAAAQPNPPDLNRLLTFVKGVHASNPGDLRVLAAYADLLARTGQRQDAANLILGALASPTISAGSLCDMLKVNDADHLDLTDAITDRAAHGPPSTPKGLYDQVRLFSESGRAVDAHRAIRAAADHTSPDWQLAILQCRELVGETDLAPAWASLADANPGDLSIQHAVIDSPTAWTDRALIERTITRCRSLTGDDAVQWRLAQARWQLKAKDNAKPNAVAAATAMGEVVTVVPTMLAPRLIWAEALERLDDSNEAIAQLRIAHAISASPSVAVELARMLASVGQYHEAVALIDSATADPALPARSRSLAVRILCQAGESKQASTLLENSPGDHTVEQDLLLAHIYADQGDDVSAAHVYSQLMQEPTQSNATLRDFAWFQASRGNVADARETLKRLDPTQAASGELQMTDADFEAAFGAPRAAVAAYQAATNEAPSNPQTWLALAGYSLCIRDNAAAIAASDRGLKWCPGNSALIAIGARARTLSALTLGPESQPLLDLLAADPTSVPAIAVLAELTASSSAHDTPDQSLVRLTAVAQRYPRFLPVQLMLASRDAGAGLIDDAVLVATRATAAFPTEAEPARLLAHIAAAADRWEDALGAATQWRSRSLAHPQPADNNLADDQEHLDHPKLAVDILSPFLPRSQPAVQASPDTASDDSTTLSLYARALGMQHQYTEMQALLSPLCKQSIVWRHQALRIIADTAPDAATTASQIAKIDAMIRAGSVDDRIALADARCTAGTRLGDNALLQKALDGLDALCDAGPAPVDAWLLLGAVHQQLNQPADAETAYRKALALSPNLPLAQNNLAMLLLETNGNLKEARALAEHAVASSPANSPLHCTLGQVAAQQGDIDTGIAQLETAITLDPRNSAALVALADIQCRAAQLDKALETLRRVDDIVQITHKPLQPNVRLQLEKVREACKRASAAG
jgi:tetratricopeptide (TPR) repeat protein